MLKKILTFSKISLFCFISLFVWWFFFLVFFSACLFVCLFCSASNINKCILLPYWHNKPFKIYANVDWTKLHIAVDQNTLVSASALEVSFKQLGAKQNDPLLSYPLQVPPLIHSKYTCINISSFFSVAITQSAHAFNLKMEYVVCEKKVLLSGPLLVFFCFCFF